MEYFDFLKLRIWTQFKISVKYMISFLQKFQLIRDQILFFTHFKDFLTFIVQINFD